MRCRRCLRAILLDALALIVTGCAGSPGKLSVNLSALKECQRLGGAVRPPAINDDTDYRELAENALARLNQANRGSAAHARCDRKVISDYAKAG